MGVGRMEGMWKVCVNWREGWELRAYFKGIWIIEN